MTDTVRVAGSHAETLAALRENRHRIRGVEILSSCCATCELDTDREFSLDAVPLLPHAHCTNPEGCRCRYIGVPLDAAAAGTAPTVVYPPLRDVTPPPTIPAHLKTPAAAMIVLGAVVIAFGINVISSTSGSRTPMPNSPSQMVPVAATRSAAPVPAAPPAPARIAKTSPSRVAQRSNLDREMEARAAIDLLRAEAIARENETAQRAQEVAAQQQTYLRNLLSRQAQTLSVGNTAGRTGAAVSATTEVSQ